MHQWEEWVWERIYDWANGGTMYKGEKAGRGECRCLTCRILREKVEPESDTKHYRGILRLDEKYVKQIDGFVFSQHCRCSACSELRVHADR